MNKGRQKPGNAMALGAAAPSAVVLAYRDKLYGTNGVKPVFEENLALGYSMKIKTDLWESFFCGGKAVAVRKPNSLRTSRRPLADPADEGKALIDDALARMHDLIPAVMFASGTMPAIDGLKGAVLRTNLGEGTAYQEAEWERRYRKKNNIPVSMVFDGNRLAEFIDFAVKGLSAPRFFTLTTAGDFLVVNSVYGDFADPRYVIGKGGLRWYGFEDVKGEAGTREKHDILRRYVASSLMAKMLGEQYITGPDMGVDDAEMDLILLCGFQIQHELYQSKLPKYKNFKNPLRLTTSVSKANGGQSHKELQVTSLGGIYWLLGMLADKELCRYYGLKLSPGDAVTFTVQGYGDVGSGTIEVLFRPAISENFIVNLRGRDYKVQWNADSTVSLTQLYADASRTANPVTVTSDSAGNFMLCGHKIKAEHLAGATAFYADLGLKAVGVSEITSAVYDSRGLSPAGLLKPRDVFMEQGVNAVCLAKQYEGPQETLQVIKPRELLGKKAQVLIPAAGPGVLAGKTLEPGSEAVKLGKAIFVEDLDGVKIILEDGNNALSQVQSLAKILHAYKILYANGEEVNGGGVYTSTNEFTINVLEGAERMKKDMRSHNLLVRDDVENVSLALVEYVARKMKESKDSSGDFTRYPYEISLELADKIHAEKARLLANPTLDVLRFYAELKASFAGHEAIPFLIAATKVARAHVMYGGENIDAIITRLNELNKQTGGRDAEIEARQLSYKLSWLDFSGQAPDRLERLAGRLLAMAGDTNLWYTTRVNIIKTVSAIARQHQQLRKGILKGLPMESMMDGGHDAAGRCDGLETIAETSKNEQVAARAWWEQKNIIARWKT